MVSARTALRGRAPRRKDGALYLPGQCAVCMQNRPLCGSVGYGFSARGYFQRMAADAGFDEFIHANCQPLLAGKGSRTAFRSAKPAEGVTNPFAQLTGRISRSKACISYLHCRPYSLGSSRFPLLGVILSPAPWGGADAVEPPCGWWDHLRGGRRPATDTIQSDPANRGAVMDRGFWRYSRHPNYFGDFCVWWGFYLIAAAPGAWWSVIGPLLMSVLWMRVSGVALWRRTSASGGFSTQIVFGTRMRFSPDRQNGHAG
jgi:hypothetical protein